MTKKLSEMTLQELWKKYEHDRYGYTAAKTEFMRKYTEIAKRLHVENAT